MEKLLPEELADRLGRLERECLDLRRAKRCMKQLGGLTVVVAILMTLGGAQLAQRTEEVRAGSILLVDRGGSHERSLPSLLTRMTEQFRSGSSTGRDRHHPGAHQDPLGTAAAGFRS